MTKRTIKTSFGVPHSCQYDWPEDCYLQCGDRGVVLSKKGSYRTAFVEAFPHGVLEGQSVFIRGEGTTISEAETAAWGKYQKQRACGEHAFDRKGRKDGYGYCTRCGVGSMVFEPLTRCTICDSPTRYHCNLSGEDWYCEEHISEDPDPDPFDFD